MSDPLATAPITADLTPIESENLPRVTSADEAELEADEAPGSANPRSPSDAPRGRPPGTVALNDMAKNAIVRMHLNMVPIKTIAATFNRSPEAIRQMLAGPLAERLEEAQGTIARALATHQFELLEMLPEAARAFRQSLTGLDEKLRFEAAKWLHDAVVPKPTTRTELDIHHSGAVQHDVSGVLESVSKAVAELAATQTNLSSTALARVRSGEDALPRPTVTLDVKP